MFGPCFLSCTLCPSNVETTLMRKKELVVLLCLAY